MKLRAFAFATLLATAAFGCASSTYEIHSSADVGVEFKYHTFSFGKDPAKLPKGFTPTNISATVKQHAEEALNLELGKRGYMVDDANPDIEVLVASGQRPNVFRSGKSYDSQIMNDGTLVVEVWDTKAGDLIWHGLIETHVDPGIDPDYTKLAGAIAALMKSFPMSASSAPPAGSASAAPPNPG